MCHQPPIVMGTCCVLEVLDELGKWKEPVCPISMVQESKITDHRALSLLDYPQSSTGQQKLLGLIGNVCVPFPVNGTADA